MADHGRGSWDEATLTKSRIGHYAQAVARELLDLGVPVFDVSVYTELEGAGSPHAFEVVIDFEESFQHRVAPGRSCCLVWNSACGWALSEEDTAAPGGARDWDHWLGAGVLPPPQRVAVFVQAAQLGLEEVGSLERPVYRGDETSEDLKDLTQRLRPYAGDEETSWQDLFHRHLFETWQGRAFDALLTTGPDPVQHIALRASEATALLSYLALARVQLAPEAAPALRALAEDLQARLNNPGGAADHRAARGVAARHRARS
jgi:hypothetical protein